MLTREEMLAACDALNELDNTDDFFKHLDRFIDDLGFDQHIYTAFPDFHRLTGEAAIPFFHSTYDSEWLSYYCENRYDLDDHILKQCLLKPDTPYLWPERKRVSEVMTVKEKKVFMEAGEVGIRHGVSTSMSNGFGGLGVLSLSFDGSDEEFKKFYTERKEILAMFSYAFNDAILRNAAEDFGKPHSPNLTLKEQEVIRWLASGMTYEQIASKLNVGVSTIRKHTSSAIRKLKARNSTHACALALKWRLL